MITVAITAVVYQPGARIDEVMRDIAGQLRMRGWRLAGFIQVNALRGFDARCDMTLQELSSGERLFISENRGREARGCMLDVVELERGATLASAALANRSDLLPDLLIINKFGKTEAAGRGFCSVMGEAIERGVPVLTALPVANLDAWQAFAGEYAATFHLTDLPRDVAALCERLGFGQPTVANARTVWAS